MKPAKAVLQYHSIIVESLLTPESGREVVEMACAVFGWIWEDAPNLFPVDTPQDSD